MSLSDIKILIVMIIYMLIIVSICIVFTRLANKNSENFFLGGRRLGPWIIAMSAEASDMSGWLLMGLPGVAYWMGIADAAWTAIGLAVGTYLNWLITAKPLRRYSVIAGNAITIPDFFSNRFRDASRIIITIASLVTLVFFTVYTASCFVASGKLFHYLFGFGYGSMVIAGALFVIIYTLCGGFLAGSVSDLIQGSVMVFALAVVLFFGVEYAGGINAVIENLNKFPGFLDFFANAAPTVNSDGVQQTLQDIPLFGSAAPLSFLAIISTLSWGLGYFGMPHVLLRFMAIRKTDELVFSRRIAVVWCIISLIAAVAIGLIGRAAYPNLLQTASAAENIFITLTTGLFSPILIGIAMSGILAAQTSSSNSYLLIASSAVSKNIFQGIFNKDATDKQVMFMSRVTLLVISLIGIIIALDENSIIFTLVSFAWAGFGATFGPLMILSLFWKRATREGAIAGMLSGAITVFVWKLVLKPMGGFFGIYELLPAFIVSALAIVLVSLISKPPCQEIQDEFDRSRGENE